MKRFWNFISAFDVKIGKTSRIIIAIFLLVILIFLVLALVLNRTIVSKESKEPEDTNVYLNEEVCFAGDIYITVVGISVDKDYSAIGNSDDDGDLLSAYRLNLTLTVEQKAKIWAKNTKIKPEMFTLKCVNLESKNTMNIFFEQLAQLSLSSALSLVIDGSVNIIEETVNFALDYTTAIVDNLTTENKFKPIKNDNKFEAFKPKKIKGVKTIDLSFPIKQEYMDNDNTIVLSIDAANHIERRVFLITRPQ